MPGRLHWILNFENLYWEYIGLFAGITFTFFWISKSVFIRYLSGIMCLFLILLQPGMHFLSIEVGEKILNGKHFIPFTHIIYFGIGAVFSGTITFILVQALDRTRDFVKDRISNATPFCRTGISDIRNISRKKKKQRKNFNPKKYFKRSNGVFVGLKESNQQRQINKIKWQSSHILLLGCTGYGKGVLAGLMLYQAVIHGEAVFVMSPKEDEWLPHVMGLAAQEMRVPFYYIDATGSTAQWNPLFGLSPDQQEEVLSAAFGNHEKGTDADFYRLQDRAYTYKFANFMTNEIINFEERVNRFLIEHDEISQKAPKFKADLLELASLPIVNIDEGFNIKKAIEEKAVVYFQGSLRNTKILKLQRAFTMSLIHSCEDKKRNFDQVVCVFIDELKHCLSEQSLGAISSIRDKSTHMILAIQSLGDLKGCSADLNPEAVTANVIENTSIKFSYKTNDILTGEILSKMSGEILIDSEIREFEMTSSMVEVNSKTRKMAQNKRPLIDTNMLMSLPPRCAVMFGDGLAECVYTAPIQVDKDEKWVTPTKFNSVGPVGINNQGHNNARSLGEEMVDVDK